MKQRIIIVVLGCLLGLAARTVVELYRHYAPQRGSTPPAATAPLTVRSDQPE